MYQVPKEVIEATLQFLASQPYNQVAKLIQALQEVKPVEEEKVV